MADNRNFDTAFFYKFNPTGLVVWSELVSDGGFNRHRFLNFESEVEQAKPYSGEMTHHSRKRLMKSLTLLACISPTKKVKNPSNGHYYPFRTGFHTLTLSAPQNTITDKEIKTLLFAPYIRRMKKYGLKNYVWKAEIQENGNLHFHYMTDLYINYNIVRDEWNHQQAKLGLIEKFYEKHEHRSPNSTDTISVPNDKTFAIYMMKYMLKRSKKGKQYTIDEYKRMNNMGKVWDCSENLKMKFDGAEFLSDDIYYTLQQMVQNKRVEYFNGDYFHIYRFSEKLRNRYFSKEVLESFEKYLYNVKNHIFS